MTGRRTARFLTAAGVAIVTASALVSAPAPVASAQPCPDVDVVFARGTSEPPGVGGVGQAFVDALRSQAGGRSVDVYPVNYPASSDFGSGVQFAETVIEGIRDAAGHVQATAANCPKTKIVLGGFSQGAAVAGFVTASAVPDGVSPTDVPAPMPPEVANHIAAVALFGKPSTRFMRAINDPSVTVGPQYVGKTIDLCVDNDLVCD